MAQSKARKAVDSVANYAYPVLGDKDVNEIGKPDILTVLEPIWLIRNEPASRIASV